MKGRKEMKNFKRTVSAAGLTAVLLVGAPAVAHAESSWHGPYANQAICWIAMKKPMIPDHPVVPCEQHDDGKWWFRA